MVGVTIRDDPAALAHWVSAQESGLIVFDGFHGAGKTTLARDVAARLPCRAVDADCFLEKKRGIFMGALRLPALTTELKVAMSLFRLVLFSSVCAREVIDRLGVRQLRIFTSYGSRPKVHCIITTISRRRTNSTRSNRRAISLIRSTSRCASTTGTASRAGRRT
jgi:hypothetical protein